MPFFGIGERVSIFYGSTGEGPPLVFVHGWGMSGSVWHGQHVFSDSYRLITPDLRGHGRSSAPESGYTFDCFARDLQMLFTRLDLDRAVVIAWSMGVLVVLSAFHLLKGRLAALAFVSGTPKFTADVDYSCGLSSSEPRGLGLRLIKNNHEAMNQFIRGMFTEEEISRGCLERMIRAGSGYEYPEERAARLSLKSLADADMRSILPNIDVPVLLVHGSDDNVCPVTAAHYMAAELPDSRLVILPGAGHAPFLSKSTEFNDIVRQFINGIYK